MGLDPYKQGYIMKKRILIVAAHPDDEVLGCGGTVARLVREGYEAHTLILGEGITARDLKRDRSGREREIRALKEEVRRANNILGVKEVFFYDFPDNRFDTVALLDVIKAVEEVTRKIKPEIIFTHHAHDLNVDHRVTYQAVVTATRPLPNETVKVIYSFEVISSTEYTYPAQFSPNVFFDISSTMKTKIKSLAQYKTEIRSYPHPRSLEGIELNAKLWGMKVGAGYAEAFQIVRELK